MTINGELPVGALVQLHSIGAPPDIRNSIPWGLVQEDGTYVLSTYETGDGAPPGEYAITLTWPWDPSKASFTERLNNAYSDPGKSQWKTTIQSGVNELPVVEIVGAKILRKESRQGEL